MLNYSKYKIEFSNDLSFKFKATYGSNILKVLKIFEFDSSLQRMSSLVYDQRLNKYYAFMKGSPEKVRELC